MGFALDDFERPIPLTFVTCSAKPEQLDEHQDLLKWGAQLVGNVRQKPLSRVHQAYLATQRREPGDGQYDAADEEHHRRGHSRAGDSTDDEELGYVGPQRDPERHPAYVHERRNTVEIG